MKEKKTKHNLHIGIILVGIHTLLNLISLFITWNISTYSIFNDVLLICILVFAIMRKNKLLLGSVACREILLPLVLLFECIIGYASYRSIIYYAVLALTGALLCFVLASKFIPVFSKYRKTANILLVVSLILMALPGILTLGSKIFYSATFVLVGEESPLSLLIILLNLLNLSVLLPVGYFFIVQRTAPSDQPETESEPDADTADISVPLENTESSADTEPISERPESPYPSAENTEQAQASAADDSVGVVQQ